MSIGPDGMMYLTTGEEFNSAQSQDPTQAGGKILRFRLDGTVPDDNPFFDGAGPNHDAVWAYGLRTPFRAWWDLEKDVFYVAEVGGNDQNTASEDIHLGSDSADYGWPYCEGTLCSWPSGQPANFSAPMFSYDHIVPPSFGGSLTGGTI